MGIFNFDQVIDRRGTDSIKWKYFEKDVLPLWVADMDFLSPPEVIQAMKDRADHGIFGYAIPPSGLVETIVDRMQNLYHWTISPDMIVFLPGIVSGLNQFCHAFSKKSDRVVVQTPVYPPFLSAPVNAGLQLAEAPLQRMNSGRYEIDFDALEAQFKAGSRLFILCNPHNPVGRVFQPEELSRIAELCNQYDVILCSDEIHCDLVFSGNDHIPIGSLNEETSNRTITFMAPSKTFNVAGLDCAFAIIPDRELRHTFEAGNQGLVPHVNIMGYAAAQAAFQHGSDWLHELLAYLEQNQNLLVEYVKNEMPELKVYPSEATYLSWIDCSALHLKVSASDFFRIECKVGLNPGRDFGSQSAEFVRLNFGCPRVTLQQALQQMRTGIHRLR